MPMPDTQPPRPGAPITAFERSVALHVDAQPPRWTWGATWAFGCGAMAAAGAGIDGMWLARVAAGWWTVVPVLGALWAPVLAAGAGRAAAAPASSPDRPDFADGGRAPLGLRRLAPATLDTAILFGASISVAMLLGPGATAVVAVGLALAAALRHRPGARWRFAARSALEIGAPGLAAWWTLGGAAGVPASVGVSAAPLELAARWWAANWLWPTLLALFVTIYHNATAVQRRAELAERRRWIGLAYIGAVACLAWAERPVGAAVVAWLWVAQWPFEARFQTGKARWHWATTERLAMAAMGVAAWAAR
ncbi:hypothetical protein DCC79_05405 [bacterium]|nr:MAG: hypothetical protein DCC79_05405 [bacterium]